MARDHETVIGFVRLGFRAVRSNPHLFVGASVLLLMVWVVLETISYLGQDLGLVFNVATHVLFIAVLGEVAAGLMRG